MANLLATCATKLTVAGTTAAPEQLMVCGSGRFVQSNGTPAFYLGTSHGSVDITLQRTAGQDFKIATYANGGNNTALRILGTAVFACNYLQSPTLVATTCTKTHSLRQTTGQNYLCLYTGCDNNQPGGMKFMSCGGTLRGYVYFDGSSNFGLLNCGGQWAIKIIGTQSSNSCMYTCHPLEATTCLKTPILCATSCTNYGACATSKIASDGDMMKHTTQHGFISLGPGNSTWAHINTDRDCFYIHKPIAVDGGHVKSYDENLVLSCAGGGTARIVIGSGTTTSCQDFKVAGSGAKAVYIGSTDNHATLLLDGSDGDFSGSDYAWIRHDNNKVLFIENDSAASHICIWNRSNSAICFGTNNSGRLIIHNGGTVQACGVLCANTSIVSCGTSQGAKLCLSGSTGDNASPRGEIAKHVRWNYAPSSCWRVCPTTNHSQCSPDGLCYIANGDCNRTCFGIDPWGRRSLIWHSYQNDSGSNGDGGWGKNICNLDPKRAYLSVVYFKKLVAGNNSGTFYHGTGTGTNNIRNIDGSANTNPYFFSSGISSFEEGQWYVSIGYIVGCDDTSASYNGGIYRLCDGTKTNTNATYRMGSSTCLTYGHRVYLYYSDGGDEVVQWWGPGFYEMNGMEPSFGELLNGHPSAHNKSSNIENTLKIQKLCGTSCVSGSVLYGTSCVATGSTPARSHIKKNASYDTLELVGHGSEMMIGAGSAGIHINYRCAGSGASTTPATWYWRCGTSTSFSNHYFGLVCSCSLIKGNIVCGATCVYSNCLFVNKAHADVCVNTPIIKLTGVNTPIICGPGGHFVISTDSNCSMVGATYSTRCFAFNGSCFKQTCELINSNCVQSPVLETSGSIVRWCYPSNCGPYLQTGGSYSAPTLALKRHDGDLNNTEFLTGKFCGSICVRSPIVCATSCFRSDNCFKFTQSNPYLCSGGSYIIVPSGIYVSGGTFYAENTTMHRNGICDDTASTLDIWGGTGSNITLRGNTFACVCLCVNCTLCMAPDSSGDMNNGITLGKVGGLPQAVWGESGSKTGRIEIGLPTLDGEGGATHHGMVHVAVDVYEYNSNDVTTIIVGGHNWNCRWYNCGAHITGGCTDKPIKLAYHSCGGTSNGRYVILLGECDSTWNYGSVHVRSITNGLFYCSNMNMGTPWYVKRVTCADSYYNHTSGDLRSTSFSMAAYQCAMVCVHTPRVCATTCLKSASVCATTMMCSAACILAAGCIHGDSVIATGYLQSTSAVLSGVASVHTVLNSGNAGASCCGLAVGQVFSNEGGWHNQINSYGKDHNILRIKKAAGDATDNAQCLSFWVHNGHAATIQSTGNLLLKAGSAMSMCLKSGLACTPILCAPTCVATALVRSTIVFPTSCLMFDENGVRSWKVCASSGNLNFHSGDGSGVFYFHSQLYSNYLHSTTYVWGSSCLCSPIVCATGSMKAPVVCGTTCVSSPAVCGTSYVNSGKFCSGDSYFCDGCLNVNHGGNVSPSSGAAGQVVVTGSGYSTFLAMDGTAAYFGHNSSSRSLVLMTNETARLTIDGSGAATFAGTVTASGGFYGDGSNLSGISAGIDGCSFQGAVGNPSGCSYERTTNVRLGTCAMPTGKGVNSTAIGNNALQYQNCSWYYGSQSANTAVGADSQQCSMGFQNTSVGWMAMRGAANNCKCYNVGIGACTGYLGILGNYSVAIGTGTDRYMSDCSVAVGAQADAGNEAVMVGFSSGANDGTFKGDVAMGYRSLYSSGCGCCRIAIGHCAGYAQGQWNHKECYNIAIGACALACGSHTSGSFNYNIVIGNPHNSCAAGQCLNASTSGCMILGDGNISNACICAACTHVSTLNKSSGSFRIKHPNPSCSNNRTLYHSFVESPNEGDNIYRWQVETSNCVSVVTLPNYYRYLNKNDMVWVSPYRHFGSAYGEVTADQCCLIICSNSDGCFNVLLVGTRKDSAVSQSWKGVERDEEWTEPCYG